jgi:hypothetical protein
MMTLYETRALVALANFFLCCFLMYLCICRINKMHSSTTRRDFRLIYCLLFAAAVGSAFSPILFEQWPTPIQVLLTLAFMLVLRTSREAWKGGVPEYGRPHARGAGAPERRVSSAPGWSGMERRK